MPCCKRSPSRYNSRRKELPYHTVAGVTCEALFQGRRFKEVFLQLNQKNRTPKSGEKIPQMMTKYIKKGQAWHKTLTRKGSISSSWHLPKSNGRPAASICHHDARWVPRSSAAWQTSGPTPSWLLTYAPELWSQFQ